MMRNTTHRQAHRALRPSLSADRWLCPLRNAQYYNNHKSKNKDMEHSIPTAVTSSSLGLKGQTGLKQLVMGERRCTATKPTDKNKTKKKIKNQKNMDYFVRTQYIHDMKWLVHGQSLLCELAFIHHMLHPLYYLYLTSCITWVLLHFTTKLQFVK